MPDSRTKLNFADLGFCSLQDKVILLAPATDPICTALLRLLNRSGAKIVALGATADALSSLRGEAGVTRVVAPIFGPDRRRDYSAVRAIELCLQPFNRIDVMVYRWPSARVSKTSLASLNEKMISTTLLEMKEFLALIGAAIEPMRAAGSGHVVLIMEDSGEAGDSEYFRAAQRLVEGFVAVVRSQLGAMRPRGINLRLSQITVPATEAENGTQELQPRNELATARALAALAYQVIATQPEVNVEDVRMRR